MKLRLSLFLFVLLTTALSKAQGLDLYERRVFASSKGVLPYRMLLPENFNPDTKYPVVFFLHGSGERGIDNQKQLSHGADMFLRDSIRVRYPAVVIFPQCSAEDYWSNANIKKEDDGTRHFNFAKGGKPTQAMIMLLELIEKVREEAYTDADRMYVAGLSMGGMGAFEAIRRAPKTFAAAFVICGGDNVRNVKKYRNIPLWIFHGAKDDIVPPEYSENIVEELRRLKRPVRYTLYQNANHNSWNSTFSEPSLMQWLFSQKKK